MATIFLKVKNSGEGTLSGAVDGSTDPVTVALQAGEGAKFPTTFPFDLTIDNEILRARSKPSSDSFLCDRAQQSTTIASHAINAVVELRVTAETITEIQDAINSLETDTHTELHGQEDHPTPGTPLQIDIGDVAIVGGSAAPASALHQHPFPAPSANYPAPVASAGTDGTATTAALSDHVHPHGSGYLPDAHHDQAHTHPLVEVTGFPINAAQHGAFGGGNLHAEYLQEILHFSSSIPGHHAPVTAGVAIGVSGQQVFHDVDGGAVDLHPLHQLRSEAHSGGGYGKDYARIPIASGAFPDGFIANEGA